jgi:cell division protease FtsH
MLEAKIAVLLGGRAVEKLIFDDLTNGAREDIEKASTIARKMVCEWGMSDALGPLNFGAKEEQIFLGREIAQHRDYSEQTAVLIDKEVRRIVDEAGTRADTIINENVEKVKEVANALLDREILDREDIEKILKGEKLDPPREDTANNNASGTDAAGTHSSGTKTETPEAETGAAPDGAGAPSRNEPSPRNENNTAPAGPEEESHA